MLHWVYDNTQCNCDSDLIGLANANKFIEALEESNERKAIWQQEIDDVDILCKTDVLGAVHITVPEDGEYLSWRRRASDNTPEDETVCAKMHP